MSARFSSTDFGWRAQCTSRIAAITGMGRGAVLLAVGDAFDGGTSGDGKSRQVLQRMQTLNPRLRVQNLCAPGEGLREIGNKAASFRRRRFDAAIAFVGNAQASRIDTSSEFVEQADAALEALGRVARRAFLVAAFDFSASGAEQSDLDIATESRLRWLERTMRHLCELHGVEWMPLQEDDECSLALPPASSSINFSVGGFHPQRDGHEMWTARMLQQPALAQLVFR